MTNTPHNPSRGQTYVHRNREVYVPQGYLAVGLIVGVHGLRGEVKVELHTDFPERFQPGTSLFLNGALDRDLPEVQIEKARQHKGHMLLLFSGISNRNHAEELRNRWLFVPEDNAVELEEGTYWIHDIIGLAVYTEEELHLGTIQDVIFTGANEVYVIRPIGMVNQGQELLIPAIANVVQKVDIAGGTMIVRLQPGLLQG